MQRFKLPKGIFGPMLFLSIFIGLIFLLNYFEVVYVTSHAESKDKAISEFVTGLWYATVTVTSVGYGDYVPVSPFGKLIGFFYVLSSIGLYGYFIAQLSNYIAARNENKKMGFNGTKFKDHTIILGWDHYGRLVADQLVSVGGSVAIVTPHKEDIDLINEHFLKRSKQVYVLFSEYDNFDLLEKVNFPDCKVVFVNTESDTNKLVTILNLKKIYPKVNVIANIDNADLKGTFRSAGVTHPLSKHDLSSKLVASYIFEPDVATLAEELMTVADNDNDHDIKQYRVIEANHYLNQDYHDAFFDIKKKYNSILLGLSKKQPDGKRTLHKNPEGPVSIEVGDYLLIITNGKHTPGINDAFGCEEGI